MASEKALARRWERYGVKFIVDARDGQQPTDENLAELLGGCVRPARPEEFGRIRFAVIRLRMLCACAHRGVDHGEGGTCLAPGCAGCGSFRPALAPFSTPTFNLGRRTPGTQAEAEQAAAGIAQCDADWVAGELTTSDDMISRRRSRHWRTGYQLRWVELAATLQAVS